MRVALFCAVLVLLFGGCAPKVEPRVELYDGPTLALPGLIERLNDEAARVPTLNADGRFAGRIMDGDLLRGVDGRITLLHAKPDDVRLVGSKDLVTNRLFDLGSTSRGWWCYVGLDTDTLWLGEPGTTPDGLAIPLEPTDLLTVFQLGLRSSDPYDEPAPLLMYEPEADAYRVTWVNPGTRHLEPAREAWYDRATLRPTRVVLYTPDGRPTLRATLSEHAEVGDGGAVATAYDILLPESGEQLRIEFDDVRLTANGKPDRRSFRRPPPASAGRVVEADRERR